MSKKRLIVSLVSRGFTIREIMKIAHVSDHTIKKITDRLKELDVDPHDAMKLDDDDFVRLFDTTLKKEVIYFQKRPDYTYIHKELKRKGVTLKILWEEYVEDCIASNEPYLKYSQFCNVYKEYVETNQLTMHINRKPGEKCEVDWAGTTIPIYDVTHTNVKSKAYLFVGCLPFSQFMFAQASDSMNTEAWISHHIDMFRYFGGVPLITVPDNCKTAVISHRKYQDLILNEAYQEMAAYYSTVIIPARVRHPKDKSSAEGSVGYLTTQIIARLRDRRFTSIEELNEEIYVQLEKLNSQNFQKREYSRRYVLESDERESLLPLPEIPYEYAVWKTATVNNNYHVCVDRNYYSVPYSHVHKKVQLRLTERLVEIYFNNERIASHPRFFTGINRYMTKIEHMPEKHKQYGDWNSDRIKKWAESIGPFTHEVVCAIFANARIEQQVYNQCITIIKLKDKYSVERLESASEYILSQHINPIARNFRTILDNFQPEDLSESKSEHKGGIVRGASYYGGERK